MIDCRLHTVLVVVFLFYQTCEAWLSSQVSLLPRDVSLKTEKCFKLTATLGDSLDGCSKTALSRSQFLVRSMLELPFLVVGATLGQNLPSEAMVIDRKTGIALPEVGEIESSIPSDWIDADNPFEANVKKQFARLDSKPDSLFYADPRFVEHVDEQAVKTMTSYISNHALQEGQTVLDLCSSWTSHIDLSQKAKLKRVSGLGMNDKELQQNQVLDDWVVQDLNDNPSLPYQGDSFDVVLCQLSVDYLTRPKEVFSEVSRILRPGGVVHILFSNRLFISKAVALWTGKDDIDHAYTVASYLYYASDKFQEIKAHDLSIRRGRDQLIVGDPVYVVTAKKV